MQDQRHRQQGHQLVEQIEGDHAAGKHQAVENAVNHQVEAEETGLFGFVLHVLKGVEARQQPNRVHNQGKDLAHGIHMEVDIQVLAEGEEHQLSFAAQHHGHAQCGGDHKTCAGQGQKNLSVLEIPLEQDAQTQQNGEKNG